MPVMNSRLGPRRGITIAEFLLALLVWGLVLAGVLPAVGKSVRDTHTLGTMVKERMLLAEIQEEITALPREDFLDEWVSDGTTPANRSEFESPLQYDGLNEHPPLDPTGQPIPGCEDLTRTVAVDFVSEETLAVVTDGSSRLIRVTIKLRRIGSSEEKTLSFVRSLR